MRAKVKPEKGLPADQVVELSWDHFLGDLTSPESKPVFLVEMKEEYTDKWVVVSLGAPITDTNLVIPPDMMAEGKNYQFRVAAKNKAGTSAFSEPSQRVQKRKL